MKKIITLLAIFLTTYVVNAQVKYPYIQKNINGQVEYVFNYDQANTINNNEDILNYLDSIIKKYDISDSINIRIIDNFNTRISVLTIVIANDVKMIANRDSVIKTLNNDSAAYIKEIAELKAANSKLKKNIEFKNRLLYITIPVTIISITLNYILLKR